MPPGKSSGYRTDGTDQANRSPNRLIHEKSPYLLQHAYNPVDWYPWGDEAFSRAAAENKPVFLSVGYSTCHWCHVMAEESFEDPGVAAILNREFVSIKVDREERPDIDSVYMGICQQMTGRGGWPLTIIMTAEKKPFFAGTYFPRESRAGMPGLVEVLKRISSLWHGQQDELHRAADEIIRLAARPGPAGYAGDPDRLLLRRGFRELAANFDAKNGGFGGSPKFPAPHILIFLIRYWHLTGETRALEMAGQTLDAIRSGGIWDHVGFGLHRYATDARWRLPHFEKMLYDQAMLALACIEAYEATRQKRYRTTAEECITYVLHDLQDPAGAFYSAEDADSPGGEGAYYTWTKEEITRILGPADAEFTFSVFTFTPLFEFGAGHGDVPGGSTTQRCVISAAGPDSVLSHTLKITEQDLATRRETIRSRLVRAREERSRPARDTKILMDLNALFCTALARAGRIFKNPAYVTTASHAMQFLFLHLTDRDGHLLHRYRDQVGGIPAFADDYAYTIAALIELYEATFEIAYLRDALGLNALFLAHFRDATDGGFFISSNTTGDLPVRKKEWYDGAIPSENSAAFENLMRLSRLTGDDVLEEAASACARYIAGSAVSSPSAAAGFLAALVCSPRSGAAQDLVITGDPADPGTRALLDAPGNLYLPGMLILYRPTGEAGDPVDAVSPVARGRGKPDGTPTAYLCTGSACLMPVSDPEELQKNLVAGKAELPRRKEPDIL
jgi:hypothetical protein